MENAPLALAYNPTNDVLYMLTPNVADNGTALASMDLHSGAITTIASYDSRWAYGPFTFDTAYASLYAVMTRNPNSGTTSLVYTLEPATGNATVLAETSVFTALRPF